MSSFAILLLCVQACLIQAVFGQYSPCQCGSGLAAGPANYWPATSNTNEWPAASYGAPLSQAGPAILPEAYTATGTGQVAAAGELLIAGSTLVAGRVPVSGAAIFEGNVPAAGSVSIAGHCGCSCNNDGIYY